MIAPDKVIHVKLQKINETEYYCEPLISREEWLEILIAADASAKQNQLDALLMFYRSKEHKSTCTQLGKKYSVHPTALSSWMTSFAEYAKGYLGDRFFVEDDESPKETYWPIPFTGKRIKKDNNRFEWCVRPELCSALEEFLIRKMVARYKTIIMNEGLDNSMSKELFKWKGIASCQGKSHLEVIQFILSSDCNFVEKGHAGATAVELLKANANAVVQAFDLLLTEKPLEERLADFKDKAKSMTPQDKTPFGDERMAAAFLACIDPQHYAPYTSDMYTAYCDYIGVPTKPAGQKYSHFLELLEPIKVMVNSDQQLVYKLHQEEDPYLWSDLLNAQNVIWQMIWTLQSEMSKNWLQNAYDHAISTKNGNFAKWYPEYEKRVKKFQALFDDGESAQTAPAEVVSQYIRERNNLIADVGSGMLSNKEYEQVKTDWPEIYDIIRRCYRTDLITREDFNQVGLILKRSTKDNPIVVRNRMWSGVFPEKVTTVVKEDKFYKVYQWIYSICDGLPEKKNNWLEDNMSLMEFFGRKVKFNQPWHRAIFAWYLYEQLEHTEIDPIMENTINLLIANKNIVLTGAPGTGKTYMAKEIARKMGAIEDNIMLVQFHPSYDYTDFVEGLRPTKEGNGFERKNGEFKQFCTKAYEQYVADASKPEDERQKFVVIIDEINRGELSKIFGELFFAIDPDYRGTKGRVKTQYQNMIDDENDPFKDGFFVPENVYIIGTMNDIDRSVESMDFAIRRRFAWVEVKATDRKEMLKDELDSDLATKSETSMTKLNEAIESQDVGLSNAYHIGPAYYLKLKRYPKSKDPFVELWDYHIKGLLEEYLRGMRDVPKKMATLRDAFFSYQKA